MLLCATDAGGVRNLAAVHAKARENGWSVNLITRKSLAPLLSDSGISPEFVENLDGGIGAAMRAIRPNAVICGTTRYESPDREAIAIAKRDRIKSVAVVDEWYNYKLRFAGPNGRLVLPDAIALPDRLACDEAIAEGIPGELCHATGSPSLACLAEIGRKWIKVPPALPDPLKTTQQATIITFLSETHSMDYGENPAESGPLGRFIGYTEHSVCQEILEALSRIPGKFVFVYRPHPSEVRAPNLQKLPDNVEFLLAPGVPLHSLCFHSDFVVGMRSMAILEAALIGCHAASFQPGLTPPQLCSAVRLGMVPLLNDELSLAAWLKCRPEFHATKAISEAFHGFACMNAADNILRLAAKENEN